MKNPPFHQGELTAQTRFNPDWSEDKSSRLGRIISAELDEEQRRFIEFQNFFFLATADAEGRCDCSFKGSEPGADGGLLPSVRVTGSCSLMFPDYAGNRMFNSLGNILVNPQVGMLFIDFAGRRRLRVNGTATILEQAGEYDWRVYWPQAMRAVEVRVEQAFWNCPKRIPIKP